MGDENSKLPSDELSPRLRFGVEFEYIYPADKPIDMDDITEESLGEWLEITTRLQNRFTLAHLPLAIISPVTKDKLGSLGAAGEMVENLRRKDVEFEWPEGYYSVLGAPAIPFFKFYVLKYEINHELNDHHLVTLELTTPPFLGDECFNGCTRILEALKFVEDTCSASIKFNNDTGLHIHASFDNGIEPLTAKRLATTLVILEDELIFPICGLDRKTKTSLTANQRHLRSTSFSNDASVSPYFEPPAKATPVAQKLIREIWKTEGTSQLNELLNERSDYGLGLRLCPLHKAYWPTNLPVSTAEIRYAPASFDREFVKLWIGLVLALMIICNSSEEQVDEFYKSIRDIIDAPETVYEGTRPRNKVLPILRAVGTAFQRINSGSLTYDEDWVRERVELCKQ